MREALDELDAAIKNRDEYVDAFERENDILRDEFATAVSDSIRWILASELYQSYRHFSVDSAGRYMIQMRRYASDPAQSFLTDFSKIKLLVIAHDEARAMTLFESMDTTGIAALNLKAEYLSCGIDVYTSLSRVPRFLETELDSRLQLDSLRGAYIAIDTESYYGKKILAQSLRDDGRLQEALDLFLDCYKSARKDDYHELTSIEYNTAMLYGQIGDSDSKKIWLCRSAISDFRAPNRDFLSLYELATTLYNEGDIENASKYIKIHFEIVNAGAFQTRLIRSSRAQSIIVDAAMKAERRTRIVLTVGIVLLLGLLWIILLMMRHARRQARRLSVANEKLATANAALEEVNKIKDGYVSRYMDLSIRYLDKIEENRHQYRQIAKTQGTEALLKVLRSPAEFADYKEFYQIFDQTFLGIFPDFVSQVNALLREDARFDVSSSRKALPTELRILAALKLGIDESPQIASFLKCSLSTVYTYRAKMRNQALCPKEEFEDRVKALG